MMISDDPLQAHHVSGEKCLITKLGPHIWKRWLTFPGRLTYSQRYCTEDPEQLHEEQRVLSFFWAKASGERGNLDREICHAIATP